MLVSNATAHRCVCCARCIAARCHVEKRSSWSHGGGAALRLRGWAALLGREIPQGLAKPALAAMNSILGVTFSDLALPLWSHMNNPNILYRRGMTQSPCFCVWVYSLCKEHPAMSATVKEVAYF